MKTNVKIMTPIIMVCREGTSFKIKNASRIAITGWSVVMMPATPALNDVNVLRKSEWASAVNKVLNRIIFMMSIVLIVCNVSRVTLSDSNRRGSKTSVLTKV